MWGSGQAGDLLHQLTSRVSYIDSSPLFRHLPIASCPSPHHTTHAHRAQSTTYCKHNLYEFEPTNVDSYGVPHGLSLRLETVVIEADGWRDRDDSWYEQVAMLFGPAYREDVLVLNLSDQYFPDQVKIGSDYSADSLEDEGGQLSDDYDWWPLDEREANGSGRSKVREPGEVPYLSSSDEGDDEDDEEDEGNEGKVDERTSSEERRNADRYVFRYVPDIAFHESQDGDLDDSDLEEYRQRQKASIKAVE
jgi:hypothetical protein